MGILKKLLILISSTLVVAFFVIGLITVFGLRSNTANMVGALESRLTSENEKSMKLLDSNFDQIKNELGDAYKTARAIVTDLYDESFSAAIASLGNQILPSVEAFDYDTPQQNIEVLMQANPAIMWVRFAVSETPTADESFEFGVYAEGADRKVYEKIFTSDFAFVKLEMQTSLAGLEARDNIEGIFDELNNSNEQLANDIKQSAVQALQNASQVTVETSESGQRTLLWLMPPVLSTSRRRSSKSLFAVPQM